MATMTTSSDAVTRMREAVPVLRLEAAAGEERRAITDAAHEALVSAGVFGLMRPRSLGGEEADLLTMVRAVREASRGDGSAGWCAMISGVYAAFAGLLPRAGAEEVFAEPVTIIAGALSPLGQAVKVPGGYRVSGRWPLGSNGPHASWFCGGAVVIEDGAPIMLPHGLPKMTLAFFPAAETKVIDTWVSTGLRGTGSHDYAVDNVFVPEQRTFWFSDEPVEQGALYALPVIAAFGTVIGAVPVGIAEHMLELYQALAPQKKPVLSPLTLQEKANVHDRVGIARANIEAAVAYLERVVTDNWAVVVDGRRPSWEERGRLWLGATHAARLALSAIEDLYTVAGASAVYAAAEFDRCLRDARTAVQHVMTQFVNYEIAGKQALGLPVNDSIWAFDYRGDC